MRQQPTWRIPVGVLLLVLALAIYGLLIAAFAAPLIAGWPVLVQLPLYIVMGIAWLWLVPIRKYLKWMETGRWN